MKRARTRIARPGTRLSPTLTALRLVDSNGYEPVYIVWHDEAWCPMACKVFETHDRAQHEADILRGFAHPNVVRLLGVEQPGCLLMEFVEGRTLAGLIDTHPDGRLSVSDAIRMAIHVGAALRAVHAGGYEHLDVKPDNVIVTRGGRPILFDFGTARRIDQARPDRVKGTDPYIAPEECALAQVGAASDVFSLGVTLYECLAGELPFADRTKERPFPQVESDPVPIRQVRPRLKSGLCDVVMSALERNPQMRPNLEDFLLSLHGFLDSGPRMWPESFSPRKAKGAVSRRRGLDGRFSAA